MSKRGKNAVTLEMFAWEVGMFPSDPSTIIAYHRWIREGGTLWDWWEANKEEYT